MANQAYEWNAYVPPPLCPDCRENMQLIGDMVFFDTTSGQPNFRERKWFCVRDGWTKADKEPVPAKSS